MFQSEQEATYAGLTVQITEVLKLAGEIATTKRAETKALGTGSKVRKK